MVPEDSSDNSKKKSSGWIADRNLLKPISFGIMIITFGVIAITVGIINLPTTTVPPPETTQYKQSPSDFNPSDFNDIRDEFSNTKLIVEDVKHLNETEIKNYPLADLPADEIKAVFTILDSASIAKLLRNISVNDLHEIQNKLSEGELNKILDRLPNETSIIIKKNLNYTINR